jgi:hypothetical protein
LKQNRLRRLYRPSEVSRSRPTTYKTDRLESCTMSRFGQASLELPLCELKTKLDRAKAYSVRLVPGFRRTILTSTQWAMIAV